MLRLAHTQNYNPRLNFLLANSDEQEHHVPTNLTSVHRTSPKTYRQAGTEEAMESVLTGQAFRYLYAMRPQALSELADEILSKPADGDELRELVAVCSRVATQGCIQLGQREAEARQAARDQADSDMELLTPREISSRFGESEYAIRQHVREGRLHFVFPTPGARRNGKIRVGEYRMMGGGAN